MLLGVYQTISSAKLSKVSSSLDKALLCLGKNIGVFKSEKKFALVSKQTE
jgi:hypothetical protein